MKLDRVSIDNYRSIKNQIISFESKCRVLVGKNEVGKSNILKALSLLDPQKDVEKSDLREGLPSENVVTEGNVRFIFSMDSEDQNKIYELQINKILTTAFDLIILKKGKESFNIADIINKHFKETLYRVFIPNGKRNDTYWKINTIYDEVPSNLKKPILNSTSTIQIDGALVPLNNFQLIDIETFPDIPSDQLEDVTSKYVIQCISNTVTSYAAENRPTAVYWQYDDKYLLPSNIDLSLFTSNIEYCLPLKSMFELAGINNISQVIEESRNKSKHGLRNLFERVATITTDHFRRVWKEYDSIQFELIPNGNHIDASIKDAFNRYELNQRSDGFKRFVSFLLFISAKVESNNLKNTLLIFDEPDLALHPSGQSFLREELIKISKHNYIVYSTHSIFMIDKKNISRHLIVQKADESTIVKEVNESNIIDEEVIYNALGYSVFETLKNENIIFEGWKDKKIFTIALSRVPDKYKQVKKLKEVGLCHAKGVKDIKNVANLLEIANRHYLVVSDNDKPARERQNDYNKLRYSGLWKRYDELVDGITVTTVEDFIKPKCFISAISGLKSEYSNLPEIKEESFNVPKTKLLLLEEKLKEVEGNSDLRKEIIEEIKNRVFDALRPSDIEEDYYLMLVNILPLSFINQHAKEVV
ncbi:AAA family ATPase [Paenibacillus sp. CAU 1782]